MSLPLTGLLRRLFGRNEGTETKTEISSAGQNSRLDALAASSSSNQELTSSFETNTPGLAALEAGLRAAEEAKRAQEEAQLQKILSEIKKTMATLDSFLHPVAAETLSTALIALAENPSLTSYPVTDALSRLNNLASSTYKFWRGPPLSHLNTILITLARDLDSQFSTNEKKQFIFWLFADSESKKIPRCESFVDFAKVLQSFAQMPPHFQFTAEEIISLIRTLEETRELPMQSIDSPNPFKELGTINTVEKFFSALGWTTNQVTDVILKRTKTIKSCHFISKSDALLKVLKYFFTMIQTLSKQSKSLRWTAEELIELNNLLSTHNDINAIEACEAIDTLSILLLKEPFCSQWSREERYSTLKLVLEIKSKEELKSSEYLVSLFRWLSHSPKNELWSAKECADLIRSLNSDRNALSIIDTVFKKMENKNFGSPWNRKEIYARLLYFSQWSSKQDWKNLYDLLVDDERYGLPVNRSTHLCWINSLFPSTKQVFTGDIVKPSASHPRYWAACFFKTNLDQLVIGKLLQNWTNVEQASQTKAEDDSLLNANQPTQDKKLSPFNKEDELPVRKKIETKEEYYRRYKDAVIEARKLNDTRQTEKIIQKLKNELSFQKPFLTAMEAQACETWIQNLAENKTNLSSVPQVPREHQDFDDGKWPTPFYNFLKNNMRLKKEEKFFDGRIVAKINDQRMSLQKNGNKLILRFIHEQPQELAHEELIRKFESAIILGTGAMEAQSQSITFPSKIKIVNGTNSYPYQWNSSQKKFEIRRSYFKPVSRFSLASTYFRTRK